MIPISTSSRWLLRLSDLGMIPVLLVLGVVYSLLTIAPQSPNTPSAARNLGKTLAAEMGGRGTVLIVVGRGAEDAAFADALQSALTSRQVTVVGVVAGEPPDAREAIEKLVAAGKPIDRIACNPGTAGWPLLKNIGRRFPTLSAVTIAKPSPYRWPNFLTAKNLLDIGNQIAVTAIIAIGMTMVIITGGIDLSVGSLIALSSVVTALLIRDVAGARQASTFGMIASCCAGVLACAVVGLFSGSMVTWFRVPSFIVTLAMMLVASGLAFRISQYQTISDLPPRFSWLGRGSDLFHIPNAVVLMFLLYGLAYILMSRTAIGRYIYAVGGNAEAARLSGVPIRAILLLVYTLSGALAGLGGIVMASTLNTGGPKYGEMYELYVIAAAVVGGTSLSGGQGKVFGTLIGAFIIAVNDNGLILVGVDESTRKIVLGFVILAAVTLDKLRRR